MNALTRIGAVVRKEFIHVGRDPRLLAVVLVMPVLQLLLFAYAISFDVRNLPTLVVDLDRTPDSAAYIRARPRAVATPLAAGISASSSGVSPRMAWVIDGK